MARFEIRTRHEQAVQIDRLEDVIDQDGGPRFILSCGRPVTLVGFQSTLAWMIGLNVGKVGYKPGREIDRGVPIVVFKPTSAAGRCARITCGPRIGRGAVA